MTDNGSPPGVAGQQYTGELPDDADLSAYGMPWQRAEAALADVALLRDVATPQHNLARSVWLELKAGTLRAFGRPQSLASRARWIQPREWFAWRRSLRSGSVEHLGGTDYWDIYVHLSRANAQARGWLPLKRAFDLWGTPVLPPPTVESVAGMQVVLAAGTLSGILKQKYDEAVAAYSAEVNRAIAEWCEVSCVAALIEVRDGPAGREVRLAGHVYPGSEAPVAAVAEAGIDLAGLPAAQPAPAGDDDRARSRLSAKESGPAAKVLIEQLCAELPSHPDWRAADVTRRAKELTKWITPNFIKKNILPAVRERFPNISDAGAPAVKIPPNNLEDN